MHFLNSLWPLPGFVQRKHFASDMVQVLVCVLLFLWMGYCTINIHRLQTCVVLRISPCTKSDLSVADGTSGKFVRASRLLDTKDPSIQRLKLMPDARGRKYLPLGCHKTTKDLTRKAVNICRKNAFVIYFQPILDTHFGRWCWVQSWYLCRATERFR